MFAKFNLQKFSLLQQKFVLYYFQVFNLKIIKKSNKTVIVIMYEISK